MELFIRIKDGQPFEHPIFGDNFRQAFPDVDINNLPPEFAKFERVERPTIGLYEVLESEQPTYQLIDGIYKDVWLIRQMTVEEKLAKQQEIKDAWAALPNRENFVEWYFEEESGTYQPPIPRPKDKEVFWQGSTSSWVDRPQYPTDGKTYKLDFSSATWVEVT